MNATAQRLFDLAHMITTTPWPTTPEERAQWSARVGLPSCGEQMGDSDHQLAFMAPSDGGRAFWDFAPTGHLTHVSVILETFDPTASDSLRIDAEALRASLDQAWAQVDSDTKGASWRTEWHVGPIDIEVYWSDPSRDEPPVEAALHMAFSQNETTDAHLTNPRQATSTTDT